MEQSIASRAEWFARLAEAIEGAQTLAWRLRTYGSVSLEARELYDRLGSARLELETLQELTQCRPVKADPEWLDRLGLRSTLLDPAD